MKRLSECDPRLQKIAFELIKELDVTVTCGHRNKADQELAVKNGKSKEHYPHSKHNHLPSLAMDIAPCDAAGNINWNNISAFEDMCKRVERIAQGLNIKIRLGKNFPHLHDMPHIELLEA